MEPKLPGSCGRTYEVERWLASGGYGTVFLARHRELDRPVALKLLHSDVLADGEAVERFLTEARITASLAHPHIVVLLDHGIDEGVPWIAYEYLPSTNLRAAMEGPVEWRRALALSAQIVGALAEAHAKGVLHRDVKPENVLLVEDGSCKVADFGTAKVSAGSNVITQEGLVLGTPAYLAPELISGQPATPQSDIYAAGVVLYELLTGHVPFDGIELHEAMRRRLDFEPPAPSSLITGLPAAVDQLVLKAVARMRPDRFISAGAFAAAIDDLLEDRAPSTLDAFRRARRAGKKKKTRNTKQLAAQRARNTARSLVIPPVTPPDAPRHSAVVPRRMLLALSLATGVLAALALALDMPRPLPAPSASVKPRY